MSRRRIYIIGPLEAEVISALRTLGRATADRLVEELRKVKGDISYTTVLTVLSRLYTRGLVEKEKEGNRTYFKISISEKVVEEIVDSYLYVLLQAFNGEAREIIKRKISCQ